MAPLPPTFFEDLKRYVGFTDETSAVLRRLHPLAQPHFHPIVDDFYAAIEAHPGARAAITGGRPQIDRLKTTLVRWLEVLLLGPHDEAYFELRCRIGRMHVRIDLPQGYMFTAIDRIRVRLGEVAGEALAHDPDLLRRTTTGVHQILDLELAIMLETYREDLMAKMTTAERLSTIGQFAAGIGHELRNPLGVIESSLFLLRQHIGSSASDPKIGRHLDKIAAEVKRSNKTITDLLELARNRPPKRRVVEAATVIASALEIAALPAEVAVAVDAPAGITVDGDPDQLAQVLSNLVINANQAMGARGHLWIEARHAHGESAIRVRDDGPGVPLELRPRIFEALFTTKAKGSGLGLALARRIAEAHGGTVEYEASERGATFALLIPDKVHDPGGGT